MSQMCPSCSRENLDAVPNCVYCGEPLLGLLSVNAILGGRYRLTRVLGCGGMGAVYLADDRHVAGREVAVKENLNTQTQSRIQFQTEVGMMVRLRHLGLPAVSDLFTEATGRQYMVMEYIAGETLADAIEQHGPLPEAQVLVLTDQLLDILTYLHGHGVLHRDVKPANIKLTSEGRPVLVDFGIAKFQGQLTQNWARLTGTPGFASPEHYGAGTDARSDIYGLGAVMYYMLTGQTPPSAPELHSGKPLTPPRALRGDVSTGIQHVIFMAMAPQQAQRYQSAAEMRQALAAIRAPRRNTHLGRWRLLALLSLGILAIVAIASIYGAGQLAQTRGALATAQAQLMDVAQARATATAQAQAVATIQAQATATALSAYEAMVNLLSKATKAHSATAGVLSHSSTAILPVYANANARNFIVEARFYTPFAISEGPWDCGFGFRETGSAEEYRLVVDSYGSWWLSLLRTQSGTPATSRVAEGRVFNLARTPNSFNDLRLAVSDDTGFLWVNGQYVASIDVSARNFAGRIWVGAGMANGKEGRTTRYENFTVWVLP